MEKFLENLNEAERKLQIASHITCVTFPLIKDKRLFLKILMEINDSIVKCVNAVLQYEYLYNRISLSQNAEENLNTFKTKCASNYSLTQQEINAVDEIIGLAEKHKKSPFEFARSDKMIILSENSKPEAVTLEKIKEFLFLTKTILKKTQGKIKLMK